MSLSHISFLFISKDTLHCTIPFVASRHLIQLQIVSYIIIEKATFMRILPKDKCDVEEDLLDHIVDSPRHFILHLLVFTRTFHGDGEEPRSITLKQSKRLRTNEK